MGKILALDLQFVFENIFLIINVIVLFIVLWKLLFQPVQDFMDKRSKGIADQLEDATTKKAQAEALHLEYEDKMTLVQQEATTILEAARKRGQEQENFLVAQAREEAEKIKARAEKEIQREQEKVKDEMKKEMIEIASFMAGKMVEQSLDEKKQSQLIDDVIGGLGEVKWLN